MLVISHALLLIRSLYLVLVSRSHTHHITILLLNNKKVSIANYSTEKYPLSQIQIFSHTLNLRSSHKVKDLFHAHRKLSVKLHGCLFFNLTFLFRKRIPP
jgi:hypothetical protein